MGFCRLIWRLDFLRPIFQTVGCRSLRVAMIKPRLRPLPQRLLQRWRRLKDSFDDQLMAVDDAVQTAGDLAKQAQRPVIIADPQDNPGAGSSGDSTGILAALLKHKIPALLGMFWAPEAARLCHKAGVGAQVQLTLGGTFPEQNGPEIVVTGSVKHLSEGSLYLRWADACRAFLPILARWPQ